MMLDLRLMLKIVGLFMATGTVCFTAFIIFGVIWFSYCDWRREKHEAMQNPSGGRTHEKKPAPLFDAEGKTLARSQGERVGQPGCDIQDEGHGLPAMEKPDQGFTQEKNCQWLIGVKRSHPCPAPGNVIQNFDGIGRDLHAKTKRLLCDFHYYEILKCIGFEVIKRPGE